MLLLGNKIVTKVNVTFQAVVVLLEINIIRILHLIINQK